MRNDESLNKFNDKTKLLCNYNQLNLLGFQYLRNKNYNLAKKSFKECIKISKNLMELDESKHPLDVSSLGEF